MKPIPSEEDRQWERVLFHEQPESEFTLRVMEKLDGISIEKKEQRNPIEAQIKLPGKRVKRAAISAAALLLVGGAWFAWERVQQQQPAARSTVNAVNPPLPDIPVPDAFRTKNLVNDYKRLQPLGLVVNPNIRIEDQGYTLQIEEVLVDRSRIVLTLQGVAPDGSGPINVTPDPSRIHITDEKGESVISEVEVNIQSLKYTQFVFQLRDDVPDRIVVRGELNHLDAGNVYDAKSRTYTDETAYVDWSFQFGIDLTKAKTYAVQKAMNESYVTPEGLRLQMKQLLQTPTGTRLDLDISLNDKLLAMVGEGWENQVEILYHLEIPATQEYRIFNGSRSGARKAKYRLRDTTGLDGNGGVLKLSEMWDPEFVTLGAGPIRFVLDGYTLPVKDEQSIAIDLDRIRKQPVKFEQSGDELILSDYGYGYVRLSGNQPISVLNDKGDLILEGSGSFWQKEAEADNWVAVDEYGEQYAVEIAGNTTSEYDGKFVSANLKYIIRGFSQNKGTKLTLKRTLETRDYQDVDWEVELPSSEHLPWLNR